MAVCSRCGRSDPEVQLDYGGLRFCAECFTGFYERKVLGTVRKYRMIEEGDRVAVAVSGGKDSAALLFALRKLFPSLQITAVHINVGIPGFSEDCEKKFRELAEMVGVRGVVYRTEEELGISTPDFVRTAFRRRICSPCGTIKRYLMNRIAFESGCTKVATGHNLDDTAEVLLNLYLQGDVQQLVRLRPVSPSTHPKLLAKIKPLIEMTGKENLYYAQVNGLPFADARCPLAPERRKGRLVGLIEGQVRGFRHLILSSHVKRMLPALEGSVRLPPFVECSVCGMPASEDPCAFCRRVDAARRARGARFKASGA